MINSFFLINSGGNNKQPSVVSSENKREKLKEKKTDNCNKENSGHHDDGSVSDLSVDDLVAEGYDRHTVQRALTISKNNLSMARDILREFVGKK